MWTYVTIPCYGSVSSWSFYFYHKDMPMAWQGPMYPPFQARLYRVLECANIASFMLHAHYQPRTNRTHYFVEGKTVRIYTKQRGAWEWITKPLAMPMCYYLGSYHNFWNYKNNQLVQAHNLMTYDVYGMSNKPDLPDVWSWEIEHIPSSDWVSYYGEVKGTQLLKQKEALDRQAYDQNLCLNQNYARTPEEVKRKQFPKKMADAIKDALQKLGVGSQPRSYDPFKQRTPQEWADLRQKYIEENGYTIRIPQISDIIETKPNFMKTEAEIKAEKKLNLMRILESPSPQYAKKYASVMTWIDNVQDTTSIIHPALSIIGRAAPKMFKRLIPFLGWAMLPFDLLDMANAIGRAPFQGLQGKRSVCHLFKSNPFGKTGQLRRMKRLEDFKPSFADILQAAQVLNDWTGVGLSLGAIMGVITDAAFGAYKYLNGEKVRFTTDPPSLMDYERYAGRGLKYSALINTAGQVFSEQTHFWNMACSAMSTFLFAPIAFNSAIPDLAVDPMNIIVPADIPTDPLTIKVIEEAGLNVNDGVGWPFNDSREISLNDLSDAIASRSSETVRDYLFRHTKDMYGFVALDFWDHSVPIIIGSYEPDADLTVDDTDHMKLLYRMTKAPLLPTKTVTPQQAKDFYEWAIAHKELTGHLPGIQAIAEKFDFMGIPYTTTYPATLDEEGKKFWPDPFPQDEFV